MNSHIFPPIDLLTSDDYCMDEVEFNKIRIAHILAKFGIRAEKIEHIAGPLVDLYEVYPTTGSKVHRLATYKDTLATCIDKIGVRVIAPIPGKGAIGIEIPNKDFQPVSMRRVVYSIEFLESNYELPVALGMTTSSMPYVANLATMPHLLICGSAGQGKTVCLNTIITSLLYCKKPDELKFVLIDLKGDEFSPYNKLANKFLAKAPNNKKCILSTAYEAVEGLKALCAEMRRRYKVLMSSHRICIEDYNNKITTHKTVDSQQLMPYIVVVIDELSYLVEEEDKEAERLITLLAHEGHTVGIHLIIATQNLVDHVITDSIKSNFPARIFFKVTSEIRDGLLYDSQMVHRLFKSGDMLVYNNAPAERVVGATIQAKEIEGICGFFAKQANGDEPYLLPASEEDGAASSIEDSITEIDLLAAEVVRHISEDGIPKIDALQKRFSIGYNKASKIMAKLRSAGMVGLSEKIKRLPK